MAGEDALTPTVPALGDVHPENSGIMPSADDVPRADAGDDLIVEFEQAGRSAPAGLVPPSEYRVDGADECIAHAHRTCR